MVLFGGVEPQICWKEKVWNRVPITIDGPQPGGVRYLSLPGAHAKVEHNGYEGAQFPWESAWLDDGEVTPEYMGPDEYKEHVDDNAFTNYLVRWNIGRCWAAS